MIRLPNLPRIFWAKLKLEISVVTTTTLIQKHQRIWWELQRSSNQQLEISRTVGQDYNCAVSAAYFHIITVSENYWKASPLSKNKSLAKVNSASQFMKCFYPTTEEWLFCCLCVLVTAICSDDFRQTISAAFNAQLLYLIPLKTVLPLQISLNIVLGDLFKTYSL